ncbi:MAG: CapA family protein [Spirochaetes bacterium]|nr:CapA family protein [Spirochaetota bacterium]MBU1078903.1 CapA family protein [Spirochaetota bacterium]
MVDAVVKLVCGLYALAHRKTFRAARPLEGNAAHMDADDRYWWGYKYLWGPVEREEPGSGLEAYFDGQDLDFAPRDGFAETAGMTLCAGGDILAHAGLNPGTTASLWDDVRGFYFSGDLAYANLESPVAPSMPPRYLPASIMEHGGMNNTVAMLERVVEGGKGIGFFSTANNHCLDMGEAGLLETLDVLDERGYPHVGTSRSAAERDAVAMVERGGVKVAFVSWTFSLNWGVLPEGREYLANYARINRPDTDIRAIAEQVEAARASGADAVVGLFHWGAEFESYPARNMVSMGHRLMELGIDVIIGNHPHNAQPMERYAYTDGRGARREGLILYALGDLLSIHRTLPDSRLGCLARIRVSKGEADGARSVRITSLEVLPTYLYVKKARGECVDYRVLDFRKLVADLRAGRDGLGIGSAERREIFRLEALMRRVLRAALRVS